MKNILHRVLFASMAFFALVKPKLASSIEFLYPQKSLLPLKFPRDHGKHPRYAFEWWYLTGHLYKNSQKKFGTQMTIFRLSGLSFKQGYQDYIEDENLPEGGYIDVNTASYRFIGYCCYWQLSIISILGYKL